MNVIEKIQTLLELKVIRQRFAYQEEHWFANGDDTCPMCSDLDGLGWLPLGTLPRYKHAHSELGLGNWKSSDSSCKCTKGYRKSSGNSSGPKQLLYTPGLGWSAIELSESTNKVKVIMDKYNNTCTCK